MRVPVYPRGADPRTSRPILRKSAHYAEDQVNQCLADWVDPLDHSRGIVAREFLPSGKVFAADPRDLSDLKTRFIANCRYCQPDRPTHYENDLIAAVRIYPKSEAMPGWDWQMEPATA